jgi:uncharacterized protein with von Willebrand factor type A (vWA) domain
MSPAESGRVPGAAGSLLAFFEDLRSEGVAVGTSEILDAFAALEQVSWTDQRDFREALASTIAKSQEDRRVFEHKYLASPALRDRVVAARGLHRAAPGRRTVATT